MRVLFYKHAFAWPRASGHDVHTYNMMRAMQRRGAVVGLVTREAAPAEALAGLTLGLQEALERSSDDRVDTAPGLRPLEERYRSYWGVPAAHVARVGALARAFNADAVVVSGLDVLPLLGAVTGAVRIWYAADEWFWHHTSQIRLRDRTTWAEARDAVVKGLYERAYRRRMDRVWVVSHADARAMRIVAGARRVDVLPNGVDLEWYRPAVDQGAPETAVFWGRLDFGPNVQALQWFCRHVWPAVRQRHAGARFTIMGFNPTAPVLELARGGGVELRPNVPDLRGEIGHHQVVVLPFVSGGGIKNKLLEAAAMARPVVCTERARLGVADGAPVVLARTPQEWVDALSALWQDPVERQGRGVALRDWVAAHHTWDRVASLALAGIRALRGDAASASIHGEERRAYP